MHSLPPARIDSRDENRLVLSLDLDPSLPVFSGHFPGHAVLPGVAQIDWAMAFAAAELGLRQRAARNFQVKFRRVIVPPASPRLELRTDMSGRRLHFTYRTGHDIASQGSIGLDPA